MRTLVDKFNNGKHGVKVTAKDALKPDACIYMGITGDQQTIMVSYYDNCNE